MEALFTEIGLSETKAKETAKNKKVASQLETVINEAKKLTLPSEVTLASLGPLLYHVASKMKPQFFHHAAFVVGYLANKKVRTTVKVG